MPYLLSIQRSHWILLNCLRGYVCQCCSRCASRQLNILCSPVCLVFFEIPCRRVFIGVDSMAWLACVVFPLTPFDTGVTKRPTYYLPKYDCRRRDMLLSSIFGRPDCGESGHLLQPWRLSEKSDSQSCCSVSPCTFLIRAPLLQTRRGNPSHLSCGLTDYLTKLGTLSPR
jgi:hypothetical protein